MRLLLHTCCAICGAYLAEKYKDEFEKITLYFYNPNIHPREEYEKRLESVQKLTEMYQVGYLTGDYHPNLWLTAIKGLEGEPENGQRCPVCFAMRLKDTAQKGKKLGFTHFATTLGISPFKNTVLINQLGEKIGLEEKINFLPFDKNVKNAYFKKSRALAKQLGFYHQKYCGCVFSMHRASPLKIRGD